jgi:MFS family permease
VHDQRSPGVGDTVTATTAAASPRRSMRAATAETYAAFLVSGLASASWAARIPRIRDQLRLDPSTAASVATLAFAAFLAAMTIGRWFGPGFLDRYGRVPVVRALAVTACAGTVLFVFAPAAPLAFAGTLPRSSVRSSRHVGVTPRSSGETSRPRRRNRRRTAWWR